MVNVTIYSVYGSYGTLNNQRIIHFHRIIPGGTVSPCLPAPRGRGSHAESHGAGGHGAGAARRGGGARWPWSIPHGTNVEGSLKQENGWLIGGLEHDFTTFHISGIISPTDFHIFQRGPNHQPDENGDYPWMKLLIVNGLNGDIMVVDGYHKPTMIHDWGLFQSNP